MKEYVEITAGASSFPHPLSKFHRVELYPLHPRSPHQCFRPRFSITRLSPFHIPRIFSSPSPLLFRNPRKPVGKDALILAAVGSGEACRPPDALCLKQPKSPLLMSDRYWQVSSNFSRAHRKRTPPFWYVWGRVEGDAWPPRTRVCNRTMEFCYM